MSRSEARMKAVTDPVGTAHWIIRYQEEHVPAGDQMQSALSRIIEWAERTEADLGMVGKSLNLPYEMNMAIEEGKSAVAKWTDARREDADPLLHCGSCGKPEGTGTLYDFQRAPPVPLPPEDWREFASKYVCPACAGVPGA